MQETMTSRERLRAIIARKPADRCGFWLGCPQPETWKILHRYFKTKTDQELRNKLHDDFCWICPQFFPHYYRHPKGFGIFDSLAHKESHGAAGPFANCENLAEVENFEWPNPEYLNFDECLEALPKAGELYRASGMWTCFYHNVMDLFGFENYLIKMYEAPEIVQAATDKVCGFYYEANERFFKAAGKEVDAFFLGNDFGTQLDLICGPEQFDRFILPWFKKFTDQGHRYGHQVILHSCGAIHRVIGRLLSLGVDCLHPLQARAKDMDAASLARDFKGKLAFLGGIDTQDLLVNASPAEVAADVCRVKKLLGPNLIVSPSHEALLPNVTPENVAAMAAAAVE